MRRWRTQAHEKDLPQVLVFVGVGIGIGLTIGGPFDIDADIDPDTDSDIDPDTDSDPEISRYQLYFQSSESERSSITGDGQNKSGHFCTPCPTLAREK